MPDLVLYDGACGLCDRLVAFTLKRDRVARFRFARLQGAFAAELLARYGRGARALDAVCVIANAGAPGERLLVGARAALHVVAGLGGGWRVAVLLRALPSGVLDAGYRWVARRRYRWFGKHACRMPPAAHRARFLESDSDTRP
jgi:predicted DCC family thiol-disulfide oxidoreductase YuxK